jgi:hypothetical protein
VDERLVEAEELRGEPHLEVLVRFQVSHHEGEEVKLFLQSVLLALGSR